MEEVLATFTNYREKYSSDEFQGFCVDPSAHSLVLGHKQAQAYGRHRSIPLEVLPSNIIFRFANHSHASIGQLPIKLPTPNNSFIEKTVELMRADIPLLFSLDVLDEEGIHVTNINKKLVHYYEGWEMELVRRFGHLFPVRPWDMLFTTDELSKMHHHFYQPSAAKLLALTKRAKPGEATRETRKVLAEISRGCEASQRMAIKPITFQMSIPESIVFNHQLA